MLTRLNPWAMSRLGFEVQAARAAEARAWGTRAAAREGERATFLADLYMMVCAPK